MKPFSNHWKVIITVALISVNVYGQRIGRYTITRETGITYNSIADIGYSIPSWRHNDPAQVLDDNRSYPIPIGFDFWYDGTRYTTISVGINGIADFSSDAATGYTPGNFDSDNPSHNRLSNTTGYTSWNTLALLYGDLTTQNQVDPLGTSFKFVTTGEAPYRVFTVEWINMTVWNQINMGTSFNFQLKLYETTGVIEFIYGNMVLGSATLNYKIGLNAPNLSGGLSDSVLLIQQTPNSTNFLPQRIPPNGYISTIPTSYSKLVFTPPTPANPTNLTFSNVTQTSMQLNWVDNANNEIGYVIYRSLDGISYEYVTQLPRGTISYIASNLLPNTTYYWRVYAVTEGRLSSALQGSQTTASPGVYVSAQTGNWNTGGTWVGGTVPPSGANVIINSGHTVTVNGDITVTNLTIRNMGILRIGNNNTARTINVWGDININTGAQFIINTGSNTTHTMYVTGNIINDGILNLSPDADSRCQVTFNRVSSQSISGTGTTSNFYLMTLNMGSSSNNILDITVSNFTVSTTNFLTITNGTFKFSTSGSITPFTNAVTIPVTGGLWINHPSAIVNTGNSVTVTGLLRVSDGVLNIGDAQNENLISNRGDIIIEGGIVNVAGTFNSLNNVTITKLNMTGGTLRVATIGSTSTTIAPFTIDVAGSVYYVSGGRIVIVREGGAGANDLGYINTGSTNYLVTGGDLQIGDYSTPVNQTMRVNTNIPVFNFVDSSANATAQLVTNNLQVNNDVLIATGTLNANGLNINVARNWTDQGNFVPGTGTVTFYGNQASTINDPSGETFYNLNINKSGSSVIANSNVTVNGAYTLTQGTYEVRSSTLTLNGSVSSSGGNLTSLPDGTVIYNQASAGQNILAADYGNLTLNAYSKNFPADTIGVASVLTVPNPATSHVIAGSTIEFNGTSPQTIPATSSNFNYYNVILSNSGTKSLGGNVMVSSNLTINNAVILNCQSSEITVKGNVSNNGTISGSGSSRLILAGGSSSHLVSGIGRYQNIRMDDSLGAVVSGKVMVNGLLDFNSGVITLQTDSDTLTLESTATFVRANGHVVGNVKVYIPNGSSNKIIPIGKSDKYLPIRIENTNVSKSGYVNISRRSAQQHPNISHPSSSIDSTKDVNAYWKISNIDVELSGPFSITLSFDSTTECIGGVSPTSTDFIGELWNGSSWSSLIVSLRSSDSTRLDGLSVFGDIVLGKCRGGLLISQKSGLWSDPTVWGGRIPRQYDTVKIVMPFTVTLDADGYIAKFIIDSAGTFNDSSFTLTLSGNLYLNGMWSGSGTISLITANDTIYGNGSCIGSSVLEIAGQNKTIAQNSSLVLKQVSILANDTLYNNGAVTIDSLKGENSNSTFVNNSGSSLTINGPLLEVGSLVASICPNTVIYGGTVLQKIKPITYCHLEMANSGQKVAYSSFNVEGNLTIRLGSNITIENGVNLQVGGATYILRA